MEEQPTPFGELLRTAREAARLSRTDLAQRAGLDSSHVYRMEVGGRRPSLESALALADALGLRGEAQSRLLEAAGVAPMPLVATARGAVRTRGAARRPAQREGGAYQQEAAVWKRLRAIGLQEQRLARLLEALEGADPAVSSRAAGLVSSALTRMAETLETPVHSAVIPAAGGQHRHVAVHVMQRLLLRAIREAADAGISRVVLVLAPGMNDALFTPLKEALEMAIVPSMVLLHRTQAQPQGLGDAVLQAESEVGEAPFAVILPDDVLEERRERAARTHALRVMMKAVRQIDDGHLLAVTSLPKSRMAGGGVAVLSGAEIAPGVHAVRELVEKPDSAHSILRNPRAFGVVGRYVLLPEVFDALRSLRSGKPHRVELTDALEALRRQGRPVYAFETEATRQDIGDWLGQAEGLLGP